MPQAARKGGRGDQVQAHLREGGRGRGTSLARVLSPITEEEAVRVRRKGG